MVWHVVKPLLSAKVQEKVEIFGNDQEKYKKRLLDIIAPENLPAFLGGTCTCPNIEGGCMAADEGPWHDPEIKRTLEEAPYWDILRRFTPNTKVLGTSQMETTSL